MVVGTRSKTKGLEVEHRNAEEDSINYQMEEEGNDEAQEEEVEDWNNQGWGVQIKKELISKSLGGQSDNNNKQRKKGTEADPSKTTDKEGAEGLENE